MSQRLTEEEIRRMREEAKTRQLLGIRLTGKPLTLPIRPEERRGRIESAGTGFLGTTLRGLGAGLGGVLGGIFGAASARPGQATETLERAEARRVEREITPEKELSRDVMKRVGALLDSIEDSTDLNEVNKVISMVGSLMVQVPPGPDRERIAERLARISNLVVTPLRAASPKLQQGKEAITGAGEVEVDEEVELQKRYNELNLQLLQAQIEEIRRRGQPTPPTSEEKLIQQLQAGLLQAQTEDIGRKRQQDIAEFITAIAASPSQQQRLLALSAKERGLPEVPTGRQTGILQQLFPGLGVPESAAVEGPEITSLIDAIFGGVTPGGGVPFEGVSREALPSAKQLREMPPEERATFDLLLDILGERPGDIETRLAKRATRKPGFMGFVRGR